MDTTYIGPVTDGHNIYFILYFDSNLLPVLIKLMEYFNYILLYFLYKNHKLIYEFFSKNITSAVSCCNYLCLCNIHLYISSEYFTCYNILLLQYLNIFCLQVKGLM